MWKLTQSQVKWQCQTPASCYKLSFDYVYDVLYTHTYMYVDVCMCVCGPKYNNSSNLSIFVYLAKKNKDRSKYLRRPALRTRHKRQGGVQGRSLGLCIAKKGGHTCQLISPIDPCTATVASTGEQTTNIIKTGVKQTRQCKYPLKITKTKQRSDHEVCKISRKNINLLSNKFWFTVYLELTTYNTLLLRFYGVYESLR